MTERGLGGAEDWTQISINRILLLYFTLKTIALLLPSRTIISTAISKVIVQNALNII